MVQFRSESILSSKYGDRFIIRSFSPMITIGGGTLIDPSPSKSRRLQHELPERLRRLMDGHKNVRSEEVIYLRSVRGVFNKEFQVLSGLSDKDCSKKISIVRLIINRWYKGKNNYRMVVNSCFKYPSSFDSPCRE